MTTREREPRVEASRSLWCRAGRLVMACVVCLLASALAIFTGPEGAGAGGHVPSPTPCLSCATPTSTPSPTGPCDLPTPAPQAAPNPAHSGDLVTLDGSASGGAFSAARWTQSAGPTAMITGGDSILASFIAPPVAEPSVVTMSLGLFSSCTPTILVAAVDIAILPPPGVAVVAVEDTTIAPGEQGTLMVRLHTDLPTARIEHDLPLTAGLAIAATPDGDPQCSVPPELGAAEARFAFIPAGCSGDACSGIQVAIATSGAIPDGAPLYRCAIVASGRSPAYCDYPYDCCDHLLACDAPAAVGDDGGSEPAQCAEGVVRIAYPRATAEFVFSIDPPAPHVGDRVHITVDTVPGSPGLIGIPVYSLRGTTPLLAGDVSPRRSSGPIQVTYDLEAVQAGTAELSIGITFEAKGGCPGNEVYFFDGATSDVVPLTIASAPTCAGDCDSDGQVSVDELINGVRIALGDTPPAACPAMDRDHSGAVRIDDLITAVTVALRGCPG